MAPSIPDGALASAGVTGECRGESMASLGRRRAPGDAPELRGARLCRRGRGQAESAVRQSERRRGREADARAGEVALGGTGGAVAVV